MVAKLKITVPSVALTYDKKVLRATMRVAGNEVAAATRSLLRTSTGGGRTYYGTGGGSSAAFRGGYQKKKYSASLAGMAPRNLTGTLARSIVVKPFKSGEGVAIRDSAFYALMLEAGAQGGGGKKGARNVYAKRGGVRVRVKLVGSRILEKRPFLTRALDAKQGSLAPRIQGAAIQGIKLVRVKGR